jgi:putative ABC transport system ATP-binding protein
MPSTPQGCAIPGVSRIGSARHSTPDAVTLQDVSKHYGRHGDVDALRDVTVSFPRGSLTAVMGLTGSGKSTLLQCAAGLERPTSGTIWLAGIDLASLGRRELSVFRRRQVGFVFQSLNLVPTLSVAENIALPLRLDGRAVDNERVQEIAERIGIAAQLCRLPHTLSGGQQQRVAIARALITDPEVIFADEPTAALDVCGIDAVLDLLRQAVDRLGQTVVVVTHDPLVGERVDRAYLLDEGRLAGIIDAPTPAELTATLRRFGGEES